MLSGSVERALATLGAGLCQSAWQTCLIAVIAAIALATFRCTTARDRYAILGSALILVVLTSCVETYHAVASVPSHILAAVAAVWLVGVVPLSVRVIGGWWLLSQRSDAPAMERWKPTVARFAERLQLTQEVKVVESPRTAVPGLIGSHQPSIVLPSSTLATSSVEDIEAILAHELAHVRRHDFSANVLQTAVETLFFFHPAIWWLSRQTRIEREHCCDDLAASLFADPMGYADALIRLEEQRTHSQRLPSGGSAGNFSARVHRLIEGPSSRVVSRTSWLPVGAFGLVALAALWMAHSDAPFQFTQSTALLGDPLRLTTPSLAMATLLGLLLGVRHACEPDHLLAVSTLLNGNQGARRAARLGFSWGVGHTTALFAVGAVLALLHRELPAGVANAFECGVSLMLIGLGARAIAIAWRHGADGPRHSHSHGALTHEHRGALDHVHVGQWVLAPRPLMIGMVHGLAGSGALTALVMANLPTVSSQIAYIAVFGTGSALGMAALSTLASSPIARFVHQRGMSFGLSCVSGVLSIAYGVWSGSSMFVHLFSR